MVTTKKIEVGEYVVMISHDTTTNLLMVSIYDELGELIESVEISDNEEYDEDNPFNGIL